MPFRLTDSLTYMTKWIFSLELGEASLRVVFVTQIQKLFRLVTVDYELLPEYFAKIGVGLTEAGADDAKQILALNLLVEVTQGEPSVH